MKKEYICAQCSQIFPTCCKIKKELEEYCFPLSEYEIENITKKSQINKFYVQEKNSINFIKKFISHLPEYRHKIKQIFPPNNFHYRLKIKDNGECVFLTDNGCLLQRHNRPFYCQIYPFWFYNQRITYFKDKYCLAQKKTEKVGQLLRLFSVSIETIENNFKLMIASLRLTR